MTSSQSTPKFRPGWRLRHYAGDVWEVVEADLPGDGEFHDGMIHQAGDYLIRCVSGRERKRELRVHAEYLHASGWKLDPDSLVAENQRLRDERQAVLDCINLYGDETLHRALDDIQWPYEGGPR